MSEPDQPSLFEDTSFKMTLEELDEEQAKLAQKPTSIGETQAKSGRKSESAPEPEQPSLYEHTDSDLALGDSLAEPLTETDDLATRVTPETVAYRRTETNAAPEAAKPRSGHSQPGSHRGHTPRGTQPATSRSAGKNVPGSHAGQEATRFPTGQDGAESHEDQTPRVTHPATRRPAGQYAPGSAAPTPRPANTETPAAQTPPASPHAASPPGWVRDSTPDGPAVPPAAPSKLTQPLEPTQEFSPAFTPIETPASDEQPVDGTPLESAEIQRPSKIRISALLLVIGELAWLVLAGIIGWRLGNGWPVGAASGMILVVTLVVIWIMYLAPRARQRLVAEDRQVVFVMIGSVIVVLGGLVLVFIPALVASALVVIAHMLDSKHAPD